MKKLYLLVLVSMFAALTAVAQRRTISLGMTRTQVRGAIGSPAGYFADGTRSKVYPRFAGTFVSDVYDRLVNGRVYELRIGYNFDESKSRLRPPLVVSSIDLVADQLSSAQELLSNSAEAKHICKGGCLVQCVGDRKLLVRPETSAKAQIVVDAASDLGSEGTAVKSLNDAASRLRISDEGIFSFEKVESAGSWKPE